MMKKIHYSVLFKAPQMLPLVHGLQYWTVQFTLILMLYTYVCMEVHAGCFVLEEFSALASK